MKTYKIPLSDGTFKTVSGTPMKILTEECFVFLEDWGWNVSHVETGACMGLNLFSRKAAIKQATERLNKADANFKEKQIKYLEELCFTLPINPAP